MANPEYAAGAFMKPPRGHHRLERQALKAQRKREEHDAIQAAKVRDGHRCRWPESHQCEGLLEGAHLIAKGMGGDPLGRVTTRKDIVSLCRGIHRSGRETVEHHELRIECETEQGADGPLSFWRRGEGFDAAGQPVYEMVAREVRPFQIARD